jgi:hypothetical protein
MELNQINNSFEQSLIDAGYKFFPDTWKGSIRGFQRRITDEMGIRYFITGYHWNPGKKFDAAPDRDQYSFSVQFSVAGESKDKTIDINFNADFLPNEYRPVTELWEVESFFEEMWETIKPDYYELKE